MLIAMHSSHAANGTLAHFSFTDNSTVCKVLISKKRIKDDEVRAYAAACSKVVVTARSTPGQI